MITVPHDSPTVLMVFLYSVYRAVAKHISVCARYKKNGGMLNQLQMHEYVPNLRILLSLSTLMPWTLGVDR